MKRSLFVLICTLFLLAGDRIVAQQERLTEADFNTVLAKALEAASPIDRRIVTEESYYTGTQMTGTRKIVSDFIGNDAKKIDVAEEFNGKKSRSNSITLNGQFFCKDSDEAWKRADKECSRAGKMMAIPDGEYEYSVEPHPDNYGWKLYTRRAKWVDAGDPKRDAARLKSIEIKFVTDESGLILEYAETRRGGLEPNGWSSTQVTRYEYDPPGLKIADPTKEN